MTLLLVLDSARFPPKSRGRGINVFHKFFKRATIPAVESKLNLSVNIFCAINGLGTL